VGHPARPQHLLLLHAKHDAHAGRPAAAGVLAGPPSWHEQALLPASFCSMNVDPSIQPHCVVQAHAHPTAPHSSHTHPCPPLCSCVCPPQRHQGGPRLPRLRPGAEGGRVHARRGRKPLPGLGAWGMAEGGAVTCCTCRVQVQAKPAFKAALLCLQAQCQTTPLRRCGRALATSPTSFPAAAPPTLRASWSSTAPWCPGTAFGGWSAAGGQPSVSAHGCGCPALAGTA
jgi:hypothetical protein